MSPMTGRVVAGRYQLVEPIGRGAMGVVWRAMDQLLDRDVAVKEVRLNEALGGTEQANAYQRTLREARTAARLSHRGVVTIFDVVEEDGRPWIIMELIRSRSLDAVLSTDGPMPPKRAARIAEQLLSALAHAHACGVLHRDVKPSNVLIAAGGIDERAVLTDFGIAQFEGDPRLTQTGMVMGSPGFTAPERIRGGDATPASDLWSLGATIYAACEGQGPYEQRGGAITTMSAIINEDAPVAPSAGRLGGVIAALLRRDPARRPSASVAASMIADMLPGLPDKRGGRIQRSPTVLAPSRPAKRSSAKGKAVSPPAAAVPAPAVPLSPGVAPTGIDQEAPALAGPGAASPDVPASKVTPTPVAALASSVTPASEAETPKSATPAFDGTPPPAGAADEAATPASRDTGTPEAAAPDTPPISPNGASPDAAPESRAAAGDASPDRPASAQPAASGAGGDDAAKEDEAAAPEVIVAAPGSEHGGEADAPEREVTAPTTPVRGLAAPADSIAGKASPAASASAPAKADRDAWWSTAYQPDRQAGYRAPPSGPAEARPTATVFGRQRASLPPQPGAAPAYSAPSKVAPATPAQGKPPGSPAATFPYQQPPPARTDSPGKRGKGGKRGKSQLTAIVALAAVVVIAAVVAAVLMRSHGTRSTPEASSGPATGPVSPTAPAPPLTSKAAGVVKAIDKPAGTAPAGYTTVTLVPSKTGTTAGFTMALPGSWQVMPQQSSPMRFFFDAPDGASHVEVDLTPHTKGDMLAEGQFVKRTSLAQGTFPGYKQLELDAVNVRQTRGALWRFDWVNKNGVTMRVDDMFFILPTANGPQSYSVYMTSPEGGTWNNQVLPIVEKMLQSFQPAT